MAKMTVTSRDLSAITRRKRDKFGREMVFIELVHLTTQEGAEKSFRKVLRRRTGEPLKKLLPIQACSHQFLAEISEVPLEQPEPRGQQPQPRAIGTQARASDGQHQRRFESHQFAALGKAEQAEGFPFLPRRDQPPIGAKRDLPGIAAVQPRLPTWAGPPCAGLPGAIAVLDAGDEPAALRRKPDARRSARRKIRLYSVRVAVPNGYLLLNEVRRSGPARIARSFPQ